MNEHQHIVTTVYKNNIVNVTKHYDDGEHIIWNGYLHLVSETAFEHDTCAKCDIKNYKAIYVDGVMVVKNGKVWPKTPFIKRFFGWKK